MRRKFYLIDWDNKRRTVSYKEMVNLLGKEYVDAHIKEAEYEFRTDWLEAYEVTTQYGRMGIEISF